MNSFTPPYPLSPPANFRDLAGIAVSGGHTRTGFAWRADDLSIADEPSTRQLVDDGLTAIIDLRSSSETANTGRGLLEHHPVSYHHVPLLASLNAKTDRGFKWNPSNFHLLYIGLYEQASAPIVGALEIIANAPGPVVFHCSAGKDRTGVLAAALLLALGATADAILADYVATGANAESVRQRTTPVLAPLMAQYGVDADPAARAAIGDDFSPAPMVAMLEHLSTAYRDPLEPLRAAGLDDDLRQRLHDRGVQHG